MRAFPMFSSLFRQSYTHNCLFFNNRWKSPPSSNSRNGRPPAPRVDGNHHFHMPTSSPVKLRIMDKIALYEKVFKQVDGDGDGKLSLPELQRCMAVIGGSLTLDEAEKVVENLDSDGDGLVSWAEFVAFMEGVGEEEKVSDLMEAFRMYEMDGCGFITTKSLKRMLSRLGESRSIEECKKMIAKFDLNSDGVLNFDEFKFMMS